MNAFQPLFKIRSYDYFPDVMIYTKQYEVGFPNGRKLTNAVAALTCDQGDCPLVESSYIDSPQWPRATENDKPFLKEFPYLAAAWPPPEPKPMEPIGVRGTLGALKDLAVFSAGLITMICKPIMIMLIAAVIVALIVIWLLVRRCRRRSRPEADREMTATP